MRLTMAAPIGLILTTGILGSIRTTGRCSAGEPQVSSCPAAQTIRLHPRYVRLYTAPGVELAESKYQHKNLHWDIPRGEIALVCLDCWNWHYSRDTRERMEAVVRESIVPLLAAWRKAGLLVIHAPAGPVAQRHPNWVRLTDGKKPQAPWPDSPAWPPPDFKQKSGLYAKYARPAEPQDADRRQHAREKRDFHPLIRPVGGEPVVLDGEELHRVCADHKVLHLVYVGFNTNACVMLRDYGIPAMNRRGYTTILVRDGTTGMETAETHEGQICTRGAIADLEQFGSYTLDSREIIEALGGAPPVSATERTVEVSGTFSIVAADPETGICGAAVASKYPAVGTVVPHVRAGVGAFCTQHWHEPKWGERALDLLAQGRLPEEVLGELLRDDEKRDKRQLAIIDVRGRAANRNPANADASGIYWGAMSGRYYACQGNTLTGRPVITAMAQAYEQTKGSLADRLMAALVAGDRAGGDHRGRLAAGIRVAKPGVVGCWLELQVPKSDDAVRELAQKYAELKHEAKGAPSIGRAKRLEPAEMLSQAQAAAFAD